MKNTGIVRKIDELGRVVLPIELRRTLGIVEKDPMEIFVEGEQIILRKYQPNMACVVTGEVSDKNREVVLPNGKLVLSPDGVNYLLHSLKGASSNV